MFGELTEKAKIWKLNYHVPRHTFAAGEVENGMLIKTLSEIMGHKNATVALNGYAHSMMNTN